MYESIRISAYTALSINIQMIAYEQAPSRELSSYMYLNNV